MTAVIIYSSFTWQKRRISADLYVKAAQVPTVSTEAAWLAVTPVAGSSSIIIAIKYYDYEK